MEKEFTEPGSTCFSTFVHLVESNIHLKLSTSTCNAMVLHQT